MKTRRPLAKPCERKGEDGAIKFKHCPIKDHCYDELESFFDMKAKGTKNYRKNFDTKFRGCFDVEEFLIKNSQLRYDAREVAGLEVLFNGIEKIHDLNSGIFNNAFLEGIENDDYIGTEIDTGEHQSTIQEKITLAVKHQNLISSSFRDSDEAEDLKNTIPNAVDLVVDPFEDLQLQLNLPKSLSINPGMMADLWNSNPYDLFHSTLIKKWKEGFFESLEPKIRVMAYFIMKGFVDEEVAKQMFGGANSEDFKNCKTFVKKLIDEQTPEWVKKFSSFMKTLTDKQKQAIEKEYFYKTEEKPAQDVIAKKLGIGVDSYKERLELAYKKLEALYPEFERVKRRNIDTNPAKVKVVPKLFLVKDNKRKEIKPTKKQEKKISPAQRKAISQWAYMKTADLAKNINTSHFGKRAKNTNFWKKNKITVQQLEKQEQEQLLKEEFDPTSQKEARS